MKKWLCYILKCTNETSQNLTYNGCTNNIIKRLKQHNGIISGGAKATKGKQWKIIMLFTGFNSLNNALSCEWKIKHPTNQKLRPKKYTGPIGRIKSLNIVMPLDKWTSNCNILNCECEYNLFVLQDYYQFIDSTIIPPNVTIHSVEQFNESFFEKFNVHFT